MGKRSPRAIALDFLDEIDRRGGKASKYDLYKVAGSEAALHRWMKGFFLYHGFLEESKAGEKTIYKKTATGQLFHDTLKEGRFFSAYLQLSRKKFRPPWAI